MQCEIVGCPYPKAFHSGLCVGCQERWGRARDGRTAPGYLSAALFIVAENAARAKAQHEDPCALVLCPEVRADRRCLCARHTREFEIQGERVTYDDWFARKNAGKPRLGARVTAPGIAGVYLISGWGSGGTGVDYRVDLEREDGLASAAIRNAMWPGAWAPAPPVERQEDPSQPLGMGPVEPEPEHKHDVGSVCSASCSINHPELYPKKTCHRCARTAPAATFPATHAGFLCGSCTADVERTLPAETDASYRSRIEEAFVRLRGRRLRPEGLQKLHAMCGASLDREWGATYGVPRGQPADDFKAHRSRRLCAKCNSGLISTDGELCLACLGREKTFDEVVAEEKAKKAALVAVTEAAAEALRADVRKRDLERYHAARSLAQDGPPRLLGRPSYLSGAHLWSGATRRSH